MLFHFEVKQYLYIDKCVLRRKGFSESSGVEASASMSSDQYLTVKDAMNKASGAGLGPKPPKIPKQLTDAEKAMKALEDLKNDAIKPSKQLVDKINTEFGPRFLQLVATLAAKPFGPALIPV